MALRECHSPASKQSMLSSMMQSPASLVYMEDRVVYGRTFDEHTAHLKTILRQFSDTDLEFKPQKCSFFCSQITYLGHIVTRHSISPDPAKVAAVQWFCLPTSVEELQSFLGPTLWFRKFAPNCSMLVAALKELMKKDAPFTWIGAHFSPFSNLKHSLCNEPTYK